MCFKQSIIGYRISSNDLAVGFEFWFFLAGFSDSVFAATAFCAVLQDVENAKRNIIAMSKPDFFM